MKEYQRFVPYNTKINIRLEEKIKSFTDTDLVNLTYEHAKTISRYLEKPEEDFIQAITQSDSETIGKYVEGLSPRFAKEIIYNLLRFDEETNTLNIGLTTGIMARSIRLGYKIKKQKPIVVQGLLITKDNKILLGIRSKSKLRINLPDEPFDYKIILCPAGYAKYNKEGSLEKPFYSELEEELGLKKESVINLNLIGHNTDISFAKGLRLTFLTHIDSSFEDIIKNWRNASDSWEHKELIGIENNRISIIKFLETKDFSDYQARGLIKPSVIPVLEYILDKPSLTNITLP